MLGWIVLKRETRRSKPGPVGPEGKDRSERGVANEHLDKRKGTRLSTNEEEARLGDSTSRFS